MKLICIDIALRNKAKAFISVARCERGFRVLFNKADVLFVAQKPLFEFIIILCGEFWSYE